MGNLLVSVFLPAYNQEEFISEAIESALDQDVDDMEIVIGDDCSTDGTWGIVQSYARRYPKTIVAFRNKENLGITGNCNELLSQCKGKYIAFHAGDDVFSPGKLKAQLGVFESDPECVLCYHDIEVFDSKSREVIRYWNRGPRSGRPKQGNCQKVASCLIKEGTGFMAALSVMVRRDCIPRTGYDKRIPFASDWLMWIEICINSRGICRFIDGVFAGYRKHEKSITNMLKAENADTYLTLAVVESKYPLFRSAVRERRGYEYYREGVIEIRGGRFAVGRRYLLGGASMSVYSWKWFGWWLYSWYKQILA